MGCGAVHATAAWGGAAGAPDELARSRCMNTHRSGEVRSHHPRGCPSDRGSPVRFGFRLASQHDSTSVDLFDSEPHSTGRHQSRKAVAIERAAGGRTTRRYGRCPPRRSFGPCPAARDARLRERGRWRGRHVRGSGRCGSAPGAGVYAFPGRPAGRARPSSRWCPGCGGGGAGSRRAARRRRGPQGRCAVPAGARDGRGGGGRCPRAQHEGRRGDRCHGARDRSAPSNAPPRRSSATLHASAWTTRAFRSKAEP